MTTRGAARRARPAGGIEPVSFAWGREVAATLRHSTLPWREAIEAIPIRDLPTLGTRDRLSLVAQFAAHQALLQFAGVADSDCDPAEWAVVVWRGSDCRLVRTSAHASGEPLPVLSIVQQFADAIAAPPLDALRQSWGRAESVYQEADVRLRAGAAADLRWMRRAALGEIASPAPDGIRLIASAESARMRYPSDDCAASLLLALDDVFVLGDDCSPLQRFSALAPLRPVIGDARSESDIVERLVACERLVIVVKNLPRFDSASRHVIDLFAATEAGVLLMPGGNDLPESRLFVVSSRLELRRALEGRTREWLEKLVESPAFGAYLDHGSLPPEESGAVAGLREPLRSFIAALALLGTRVPRTLVSEYLKQFLFGGTIEDLVVDGVTAVDGDALVFAAEAVRDEAAALVPQASRASLIRVAAQVCEEADDLQRAASLRITGGEVKRGVELLERVVWSGDDEAICAIRGVPRASLSPSLAATFAAALLRAGRYRDARDAASAMAAGDRETMLAAIERRTGDYASALNRLECDGPATAFKPLRAELLYLQDRTTEALQTLAEEDNDPANYLRAIITESFDATVHDQYLAARLAFYRSSRIEDALAAIAAARTVVERIDATLDHLFALFTAGRWSEARAAAIEALALVDETQGDRAAGGILFILAFLSADDGQWVHAAQLIRRLKQFYATTGDERRLRELDLLNAHLDFSRGRFEAAARTAATVLDAGLSPQITEAAALIVDEVNAILHREEPLRSTGKSGNAELLRRRRILECGGTAAALEQAESGSSAAALQTFRMALRRGDQQQAHTIAKTLGIDLEEAGPADIKILRTAAVANFPFSATDFGPLRWRFVTKNRLGRWNEIGSLEPLEKTELEKITAGGDWIACGERELLFVEGAAAWTAASKDAIAALFRLRSENHRLRRVVEQEEATRETAAEVIDGIVGQSDAMRDVSALISRVARRDVAVCILGESGTGKELVARAIHRHSSRRAKPFTAVNCAALPENLIESELFGCARGAFTGADRDRAGLIETTEGGTLFLDEIGEMPLAAQAKLLRFLQDGDFRRVGETNGRTADVRIVTATNRKLEAAVEQGRFREDLYYRICGIEIALPPLRDRAGDVALLAAHFVARERERHRGGPSQLSPDVQSAIAGYSWPGNVRELQNTIRAAHALAGEARTIDLEHLPARVRGGAREAAPRSSYSDAVTKFRRDLIERSLTQSGGNQNRAAAMLNMSRQALAYQIRELGILVKAPRM